MNVIFQKPGMTKNYLIGLIVLLYFSTSFHVLAQSSCPDVIDPVCGSNGVTYLNSCYALAAGITAYTKGLCYSDCIDPQLMDSDPDCVYTYDPVCACNGVTYLNACLAEANGITSYMQGACSNDDNCYDPVLIFSSEGATLDHTAGIISLDCQDTQAPVCGCDGITYPNACTAEASGITFYTSGICTNTCVDPWTMDPDANCGTIYEPVCGCNNITYTNECEAAAAGLLAWSEGPCWESESWCNEAVMLNCGDFLSSETTFGTGNQINFYPECTGDTPYAGPEKVYRIDKGTTGDLQIAIEIMTPNLDMDLFLLSDNCESLRCLASSTGSNITINKEEIIFEDAPIGTYYIVVDGKTDADQGDFRLEVNCGNIQCADAISITCGQLFSHSTINGTDNVALYTCEGDQITGENNGPEIVHQFTLIAPSLVNLNLSNLSANLELFLLESCDRSACLESSKNPGLENEIITTYLEAGTYYIIVDGNNGAVSAYDLLVTCSGECELDLSSVSTSASSCGQNTGEITLVSQGGAPSYVVNYTGPVSGSFATDEESITISDLPPGMYSVRIIDGNGCAATTNVTVESAGNLTAALSFNNAVCGSSGSLTLILLDGTPTYTVHLSGALNNTITAASSPITIPNLPAGDYMVYVTDAEDCSVSAQLTIEQTNGDFGFTTSSNDALCGTLGSVDINVNNGQGPYTINVAGPISRTLTSMVNAFNIPDLPGGTYVIGLEDANHCTTTEIVSIEDENLFINTSSIPGACNNFGAIIIDIANGSSDYYITWDGPVSGDVSTANSTYTITDLPDGTYNIQVWDANWCSDFQSVTVDSPSDGLLITEIIPIPANCFQSGAFWIEVENGQPGYTITWTGPVNGSLTTDELALDIPNIPEGEYILQITDANGCSDTHNVLIEGADAFGLTTVLGQENCQGIGEIHISIDGGEPDYVIVWNGPEAGSAIATGNTYSITDLDPGIYSVDVIDSRGCISNSSINLNNIGVNAIIIGQNLYHPTCNESWSD